jgi:serine/threonine protein kinase
LDPRSGEVIANEGVEGVEASRMLASISHPNFVPISDVVVDQSRLVLAMEMTRGERLRTWMEGAGRACAWPKKVMMLRELANAIDVLHEAGLIHRDIKPENIMIDEHGKIVLLDFGLATKLQRVDSGDRRQGIYHPGHRMMEGTAPYMSAEQLDGATLTSASDVYAFAVLAYEMLAGSRPYAPEPGESWRSSIAGGVRKKAIARVPSWLLRALSPGLAEDPRQRFARTTDLIAALEQAHGLRKWRVWGLASAFAFVAAIAAAVVVMPQSASSNHTLVEIAARLRSEESIANAEFGLRRASPEQAQDLWQKVEPRLARGAIAFESAMESIDFEQRTLDHAAKEQCPA